MGGSVHPGALPCQRQGKRPMARHCVAEVAEEHDTPNKFFRHCFNPLQQDSPQDHCYSRFSLRSFLSTKGSITAYETYPSNGTHIHTPPLSFPFHHHDRSPHLITEHIHNTPLDDFLPNTPPSHHTEHGAHMHVKYTGSWHGMDGLASWVFGVDITAWADWTGIGEPPVCIMGPQTWNLDLEPGTYS